MSSIYFDAERLKYKNVGLYHFCLHLGNALIQQEARQDGLDLYLYTAPEGQVFENSPRYVAARSIHKFIRQFKVRPDIWHASHQLTDYLPRDKAIKKVLTVHDLNFLREKSLDKQKKYLQKVQANLDRVDRVVCISHFVQEELEKHCALRGKEVQVIYNGNNIKEDIVPQKPQRKGLNLEKPFIFSIGAVLRKKNFHVLPHLLVGNNYNLIIAGEITDRSYYEETLVIAQNLGVAERVFFTGPVTEAEKYYLLQNCALFCFPSITEGFGLPVVEAMHFGCAILSSPATSLPEIGGDVVRYLDSFDPDYLTSLARNIETLKISEAEQSKVRERAQLFSWEHAAKSYWTIYKELL